MTWLAKEIEQAAKWLVNESRSADYGTRKVVASDFDTLFFDLVKYFRSVCDYEYTNIGSRRHKFSGELLAAIFAHDDHEDHVGLKNIGYVVIEEGKVSVRRLGASPEMLRVRVKGPTS